MYLIPSKDTTPYLKWIFNNIMDPNQRNKKLPFVHIHISSFIITASNNFYI